MQDNDGWELIGRESPGYYLMEKVPKWVQYKMRSMDMNRIMPEGKDEVRRFYPLRGRRYIYRIYASPGQGGPQVQVYRKSRGRSHFTRRSSPGINKALVSVLAVIGAVLLLAFLARIL